MKKRLPPKILLLSVLISATLHYLVPVVQIISLPFSLFGLALVIAGWSISLWAEYVIDAHDTPLHCQKIPTTLVATGPFSFSRNPFYLGYLVVTIGVAFLLGSLTAFLGPLFFFISVNFLIIPKEEKTLQQVFSLDYRSYRNKVRRWL